MIHLKYIYIYINCLMVCIDALLNTEVEHIMQCAFYLHFSHVTASCHPSSHFSELFNYFHIPTEVLRKVSIYF
jgi:hypothetical protein